MQYFRNVNLVDYRNHIVLLHQSKPMSHYLSISLSVFVVLLYNERPRIIIQTLLLFSMEIGYVCVRSNGATRSNDWILLRLSSVFVWKRWNFSVHASVYLFVCLFGLMRLIFQPFHSKKCKRPDEYLLNNQFRTLEFIIRLRHLPAPEIKETYPSETKVGFVKTFSDNECE